MNEPNMDQSFGLLLNASPAESSLEETLEICAQVNDELLSTVDVLS